MRESAVTRSAGSMLALASGLMAPREARPTREGHQSAMTAADATAPAAMTARMAAEDDMESEMTMSATAAIEAAGDWDIELLQAVVASRKAEIAGMRAMPTRLSSPAE
jgi:hypothetical protein